MKKKVFLSIGLFVGFNFLYANNLHAEGCDTVPNAISSYKGLDKNNWKGYSEGQFVKFKNKIYELEGDWWTSESPEENKYWIFCKNIDKPILSIKLPQKPSSVGIQVKPTIKIYHDGVRIAKLDNAEWGETAELKVKPGTLTIHVSNIGSNIGHSFPSKIKIKPGENKQVDVYFKKIDAGSVDLKAKLKLSSGSGLISVPYIIKDLSGNIVTKGDLTLNSDKLINDLPVKSDKGTKYIVQTDSFVDAGKHVKTLPETFVVNTNKTTNVNLDFESWPLATERVDIVVSHLPKGKEATLNFLSKEGDIRKVKVNCDGIYTQILPKDDTSWRLLVDKDVPCNKTNISPQFFIANQDCLNGKIDFSK